MCRKAEELIPVGQYSNQDESLNIYMIDFNHIMDSNVCMKVAEPVILARRKSLANLLEDHRYLPLAELCRRLKISSATARRDLRALALEKKITRTYGGALSAFDANFTSFSDRRGIELNAKRSIAQKARRLIKKGMTCFFDGGTTVFALAEALVARPVEGLCAVTNSLPVAEILARCAEIEVYLIGGRFLQRQSIILGKLAAESVAHWKFELVFLGAEGFSRGGIWASEPEVAAFQRTLINQTRKVVVCADAAKLDRETGVFLAPWTSKFRIVTDASPAVCATRGLPV